VNHFKNILNKEELRKQYLELLKKNHPDIGESTATCQEIINEYNELSKKFNAQDYSGSDSKFTYSEADSFDAEISEILAKIIIFNNIKIEIIGFWIWVSGNTFEVHNELKELKFLWSAQKKAWYYNPMSPGKKKFFSKYKKLDDVRATWGSQEVENKPRKKVAA